MLKILLIFNVVMTFSLLPPSPACRTYILSLSSYNPSSSIPSSTVPSSSHPIPPSPSHLQPLHFVNSPGGGNVTGIHGNKGEPISSPSITKKNIKKKGVSFTYIYLYCQLLATCTCELKVFFAHGDWSNQLL